MPYASNDDLPAAVRAHLPPHAQDIYRGAFNGAWEHYDHDEDIARRVAWTAVKRRYVKVGRDWVQRAS